nr:response regulator [Desulfobaculum xiamenense]
MDAGILIRRILERKGHAVFSFTEEEEALDHIRRNAPALAILDIKLKKMTGVEVLEEIRKISKAVKVIMLTGYPTLETARRCQELGAVDYCVKPIDKEELEEKVARALAD